MRLSEAIRLGSTLRPQGFEALFSKRGDTVVSCAFGAAFEAVGAVIKPRSVVAVGYSKIYIDYRVLDVEGLLEFETIHIRNIPEWSEYSGHDQRCPACMYVNGVGFLVTHLNDTHKWDRLKIADWVETVENQFTQASLQALSQAVTEEELCPA